MVSMRATSQAAFRFRGARGEIEQGGDAAEGVEAEQQDGEALHVRHEHAHMLPRIRHGGELAPEDQRTQHQPPIGDGLAFGIFQRRLVAPEIIAGVHESFEQALARTRHVEFGQGASPFDTGRVYGRKIFQPAEFSLIGA